MTENQTSINEACNSEVNQLKEHNHENIIKYYDHFIENEHLFIVIEFCEVNLFLKFKIFLLYIIINNIVFIIIKGGDLDDYLEDHFKTNKTINKDLVVKWLEQMVLVLKYLHSKNAIHRDFKPG